MKLNRIYQGRVVRTEIKSNGSWENSENWKSLLLEHHEVFQAAVNYYLLCFATLAGNKNRPSDNTNCPVYRLREQMKEKWEDFTYKGVIRKGMQKSVGEYLFPDNPSPKFEDCLDEVLKGKRGASEEALALHKALDELIEKVGTGSGAIQQAGVTFFPMFCDKETKANFPRGENRIKRQKGEYEIKTKLLEIELFLDTDDNYNNNKGKVEALAKKIQYSWLANISKRHLEKPIKDRLKEAIKKLEEWIEKNENKQKVKYTEDQCKKELKDIKKQLESNNINGEEAFEKTNTRTQIGLVFKHFPNRFTAILMCVLWNKFNQNENDIDREKKREKIRDKLQKDKNGQDNLDNKFLIKGKDPIKYCRGERGYIFPAFTALPQWGGSDLGKPEWKEFDIAAFKEALTVIHQVDEQTQKKEKDKNEKKKERDWMEKRQWTDDQNNTKTAWKSDQNTEEESEEPPFIGHFEWNQEKTELEDKGTKQGDPRIKQLRELLEKELAQEYFGEDKGAGKIPYGLKKRTLRGFNEIRKKWRHKSKGKEFSEDLKKELEEELKSYQKKNKYSVGSAPLFKELLEKENWIIWQEPKTEDQKNYNEQGFAENPLDALCDWYELKEDIEKLDKPIQFTPADPEHSRRLFRFGDVAPGFNKTSGAYGHDENSLSFRVPVAVETNGKLEQKKIKIHYSAPRLFRDSLRKESGEELEKMPWLQPMMSALDFSKSLESLEQNFSKCNVQLMPDKTRLGQGRFLLNFPIELKVEKLQCLIGQNFKVDWKKNCGAGGNKYLKWPKTDSWKGDEKMDKVNWFKKTNQFTCLSIDLGQRSAGAFALIEASATKNQKAKLIDSEANKNWYASVKDIGLLRLPGEDMKFYQNGKFKTEPYGYKGRKASAEELKETKDVISSLIGEEAVGELLGGEEEQEKLSFPELNDKLLVAIRRSQGRLSQYFRWAWMLGEDDKKEKALREMKEQEEQNKWWSNLAQEEKNTQKLQVLIKGKIPCFQEKIEKRLLVLANRILPLRGQKWEWVNHPEKKDCHLLQQTVQGTDTINKKIQGQRGLSMKRIEQIEELRCRFQSLNQSQRKKPGDPPPSWSKMRDNPVPDPCPDLLKKLGELKKQRVNQTAHLILAEALGVQLKVPSLPETERKQKDIHGEYEKVRTPVSFIVIEDLSRYLAKQDRAPNENSRLMKWSHRAVTTKLKELCEPYGIPVLEVPAAYSSRFCSRTGVPGFRAEEVTFKDKNRYPYKQWLEKDEKEDQEEKDRREFLEKLFNKLENHKKQSKNDKLKTALVPKTGGPIFVPIKNDPPNKETGALKSAVMQADINAAINVGLRAIASPLVGEIHHRIRSEVKGKKIIVSKTGSIEKRRFKTKIEVKMNEEEDIEKINKKSNFFIDRAEVAKFEKATIEDVKYASGKAIWTEVKNKKWERCEELNK